MTFAPKEDLICLRTLFSPNPEVTANMSAIANAQVLAGILILFPAKKYYIKTFPPLIPIPYLFYSLPSNPNTKQRT
jgi:hypothetical protein